MQIRNIMVQGACFGVGMVAGPEAGGLLGAAGTCPTSCMIKKTVISAATIVMPRAHRKELTGLKALKGIGRDPGA